MPRVTAQILNSSLTAGQQLNDVFNLPDDFPARSVRVLGCVIGVLFFGVDAFAWVDGRPDLGVMASGQVVALIDSLPSAEELIDDVVTQAAEVIKNLSSAT